MTMASPVDTDDGRANPQRMCARRRRDARGRGRRTRRRRRCTTCSTTARSPSRCPADGLLAAWWSAAATAGVQAVLEMTDYAPLPLREPVRSLVWIRGRLLRRTRRATCRHCST